MKATVPFSRSPPFCAAILNLGPDPNKGPLPISKPIIYKFWGGACSVFYGRFLRLVLNKMFRDTLNVLKY